MVDKGETFRRKSDEGLLNVAKQSLKTIRNEGKPLTLSKESNCIQRCVR